MRSADTSPEAERVQIEIMRRAGPARRLGLARSLSCTIMQLTRDGIRERDPTASDEEIGLQFVKACYGSELAEGLRKHLNGRRDGASS